MSSKLRAIAVHAITLFNAGWHVLVDGIAGIKLAVGALPAVYRWHRRYHRGARDAHRAQHPIEASAELFRDQPETADFEVPRGASTTQNCGDRRRPPDDAV